MTIKYYVLDTLAAAGADATVANSYLNITPGSTTTAGSPQRVCLDRFVTPDSYKYTQYTAGTAGTYAIAWGAAAAGDTFSVSITVFKSDRTGTRETTLISYQATATLTSTQLGTAITAAAEAISGTHWGAAGTTTTTWTADAGWEQIFGSFNYSCAAAPVGTSVPGTSASGTAAQLTALGLTFSGTTYDTMTITYNVQSPTPGVGNLTTSQTFTNVYFINIVQTAGYVAAFRERMEYIATVNNTYTGIATEILAWS